MTKANDDVVTCACMSCITTKSPTMKQEIQKLINRHSSNLRSFNENDWMSYQGCESSQPWIGEIAGGELMFDYCADCEECRKPAPTRGDIRQMTHHHNFTVQGRLDFPLDMLRYDSCFPKTQKDVTEILTSMLSNGAEMKLKRVTLVRKASTIKEARTVTPDRWLSFGWRIID